MKSKLQLHVILLLLLFQVSQYSLVVAVRGDAITNRPNFNCFRFRAHAFLDPLSFLLSRHHVAAASRGGGEFVSIFQSNKDNNNIITHKKKEEEQRHVSPSSHATRGDDVGGEPTCEIDDSLVFRLKSLKRRLQRKGANQK